MAALSLLIFFALFHPVFLKTSAEEQKFFKNCKPFSCRNIGGIEFPFTNTSRPPSCGPFVVRGCDEDHQQIQLVNGTGKLYEVEEIFQDGSIVITDTEFQEQLKHNKCEAFNNFSFPSLPYASFQIMQNLTLFKCPHTVNMSSHFDFSYKGCKNFTIYYNHKQKKLPSLPLNCSILQLPVNIKKNYDQIFELLTANFSLEVYFWPLCYWCHLKGGKCPPSYTVNHFQCIGVDEGIYLSGDQKGRRDKTKRWKLVLAASGTGIGVLMIVVYYFRTKISSNVFCWNKEIQDCKSIKVFLKNYGSIASKRYSYSEVKKMTESFKDKLGQGGFGDVFKGKLLDDRLVAVKILKKSKSNGEEFINEVASISRTSHVNVVNLLGFCFEGSRRALIYEFMSNGSLDKYLHVKNPSEDANQLGWQTLYQIAVGIARGLEYLHRGCNTSILHFDIKPHNILLDENFCPKISDFGLAKIFQKRGRIVSMLGARGTAGYIAPEVFCRNFGGVSHKSDVYSYGMLVLEMVGARNKNVSISMDRTSEIYFPDWICKRLELGEELELRGISNKEENQVARKMVVVSLWCIQTNPSNRPSMSRVVEMLQGSLESLSIPPRPCLSSPPRTNFRSDNSSLATTVTMSV